MNSLKGQLTLRGVIIGCIGCIVITTSSMYVALKMGALPWPILFAAIISLFFLKLLGNTNLHEVNVTHTIMSAGAMVAGGLAFTIPGIWMLGYPADSVDWQQMLIVALSGVILGLICTAALRKHFIEDSELEFPLGEATSQTLIAGDSGGKTGLKLFGSLTFAGIYTALRDWFGIIPAMFLQGIQIPGIAFGIYNSPMLIAIGFIVGTGAVIAWFIGALVGNLGLIAGGSALGIWDVDTASAISSSIGMGVMMGCGIAVVFKVLLSAIKGFVGKKPSGKPKEGAPEKRTGLLSTLLAHRYVTAGIAAFFMAAVALMLCFALQLGPLPSVIIVIFAWITTAMSAQSVGQTGIDPMEIFGLIVLLIVAAFSDVSQVQLFFVAGVIAVACGLTGDVMNDFKAGHNLSTNPKAQWIGQLIGGLIGAGIAVFILCILVQAYGTESFGPGALFISTQASIVATMISGIPSLPAFLIGLLLGFVLYCIGLPAMMVGLGIYLPFYMSFTAFLGMVAKLVYDFFCKRRLDLLPENEKTSQKQSQEETGLVVSSGLLGGESIVGVVIALVAVMQFFGG